MESKTLNDIISRNVLRNIDRLENVNVAMCATFICCDTGCIRENINKFKDDNGIDGCVSSLLVS
jgi:hypothetical protein